jgi:hypothetical protein
MSRRNRDIVDILEDHERDIRRLRQALARGGGAAGVTDHGALTGLTDDDHVAYALADGTRDFTGDVRILAATVQLRVEGSNDAVGDMVNLALVNKGGGTNDADEWVISHRGAGSEQDLLFFYRDDSAGPTWHDWMLFDFSGDEILFHKHLIYDPPAGKSGGQGLTIWNGHASGYAAIELGGTLGAYIDFKNAEADDYDIRLRLIGNDTLTLEGGNLDMKTNEIVGLGKLTFSDAEPWKIEIHSGDFTVFEGATNRFRIYDDDTNGGFKFYGNTGTNIINIDNNDLAVLGAIRAGSTAANVTDGYIYCNPTTTGLAVNTTLGLASGATYYMIRFTSARKYKDHISYASQEYLANLELKPATFWRDDDQEWFIGLIADDLAETDYRLATYVGADGSAIDANGPSGKHVPLPMDKPAEPDNIATSAVLAVLGAKANRGDDERAEMRAKIESLEDALRNAGIEV